MPDEELCPDCDELIDDCVCDFDDEDEDDDDVEEDED